jgi:hypothetical protein
MSAAPFAPASAAPTPVASCPDYGSASYGDAFSRINALVIVGEAMADRHFRRLAALLPRTGRNCGVWGRWRAATQPTSSAAAATWG